MPDNKIDDLKVDLTPEGNRNTEAEQAGAEQVGVEQAGNTNN